MKATSYTLAVFGLSYALLFVGAGPRALPGQSVSDNVAATLRGGACYYKNSTCAGAACGARSVVVSGSSTDSLCEPDGDVDCGGTTDCGLYFGNNTACAD